ncbi:questin oxidase family protein [Streptosporangium soli]|nr:questin oxidase family protein [Streptosporangium sp. KLBMP 9127]
MDQLDEALHRLAPTGPEFSGGLSNHGPMAVEALTRLGFADALSDWVSTYLPKLDERPGARMPVDAENWRAALGDMARVADWTVYFERRIEAAPWREVTGEWWPRLVPGAAAGATHGIIRTSHALRGLVENETRERRTELAHALAYWASAHRPLAGPPATGGRLRLDEAIGALPLIPGRRTGNITTNLGKVSDAQGFDEAVTDLAPPQDVPASLHELARAFAEIFLTHGRKRPVVFLHAITAPVAVASVIGELPEPLRASTHDALWQVAAAIYTGYAADSVAEPLPSAAPLTPEDLAERALANGDEHAIKLTEAALREYAISSDPIFLQAAGRGIELIG